MYRGQAQQDRFVLKILKNKRNGYFLEIGSEQPIYTNNTYFLETAFHWKGIMVEMDAKYLPEYQRHRLNSVHVIQDATIIDYKQLFEIVHAPFQMDYLSIDLEVNNGSTLKTLENLNEQVLAQYTFATVTFEHDIYHTDFMNTRARSREIFASRGYFCVFEDVNNEQNPYEDWYVHPDFVDMAAVHRLIEINQTNYQAHPITGKTINWTDIVYI